MADNFEWIVEVSEDFLDGERVAQAVENKGRTVHRIQGLHYYTYPRISGVPIGYGSNNFILKMSRQPHISEGVFDWHNRLRCSNYYNYVYPEGRIFLPYGSLKFAWENLLSMYGEEVFIRPDSSLKPFDGQVVKTRDLKDIETHPSALNRAADDMIVIDKVREIGTEYRVFCRNGKAVCHSSYLTTEFHPAPKAVIDFAEVVAKKLIEPVNTVLSVDVTVDRAGRFIRTGKDSPEERSCRLIEIGGVNSAGLYGCDINAFIEMMEAEAEERRKI